MTNLDLAQSVANNLFGEVHNFFEIHRGVMNYKYQFTNLNKNYIIRCYPKGREFLAFIEFKYMELFEKLGIKSPHAVSYSDGSFAYLIYEKLEGSCLNDVYDSLLLSERKSLCSQVFDNYKLLSEIKPVGYGNMLSFNHFQQKTWREFLSLELSKSFVYLDSVRKPFNVETLKKYVLDVLDSQVDEKNNLVWSDFNPENIIVNKEGQLAGFIDFEGIIGGDSLLGIGYLQARNSETLFYNDFYNWCNFSTSAILIDFYSILRYLRLVCYENTPLPNGVTRSSVESFLPNSLNLIYTICS